MKKPAHEYDRFRAWMAEQLDRDDPIGDLAEDMRRDAPNVRYVPGPHGVEARPITTVFGFLRWVRQFRTSDRAVLDTIGEAYREWRATRAPGVSPRVRFLVFKRDGYRCQLCGRTRQDGVTLEVDHITPRAQGGSSDLANLWTLCWDCNRGKSDLPL